MSFVHLHTHTHYSLLEATSRPKDLAKLAAQWEMPAIGFTDSGNMFGAVESYFAAKDAGVKPILGLDVYLAPKNRFIKGEDPEAARLPNTRLVLLAKSMKGYQSLSKISSIGFQEGFYYKARIDYEVLKEYSEDLICLTGGLRGAIPFAFREKGEEEALKKIDELKAIYGDDLFLEIQRTKAPEWKETEAFMREASKLKGIPLVATNDVYYTAKGDNLPQEVLICIGTNKTLMDESRWKLPSTEYFFKSPEEMRHLFKDLPEAVDATLEIADRCNLEFQLSDGDGKPIYHLPSFPTKEGRSVEEELEVVARSGLEKRFDEAKQRGEEVPEDVKPTYYDRLDYEIGVIKSMGFVGYFLIVQDFIHWAKEHGIPVGPGRGSGAGSLVAYSLTITDLDPMRYNLIFERFLNPERISMPDFDIDFCQDRRPEVIDYVTKKYGEESVSQIITFGKLQTRAAVRDVGRVLGMTFAEVDVVSKLIPDELGISLSGAIEKEPRLREMMEDDPKIAQLMELAQKIEGLNRHAGIHAAGVVIADGSIVQHAPLYRGREGENVVQYEMKASEKIGLIKFDFLGLKTLTHVDNAFKLIKANRGKDLTVQDIPMSDPGIYELMSEGNTAGVFQFEGSGITDLIKKVKPTCFEDITAINALYRPGPMQNLDEYIARKHGKVKIKYLFDELEPILSETYGIIVYQEQVQLIAAKIANYSLGEADLLRRAMGKKKPEEMAKQRTRFLQGAKQNGFDQKKSEELFDLMAKFAEYGFNKSHAAAYCVVAAYTAWLKRYYPVEFFAALLSTEMSNTDKVVQYTKDARSHGFEVRTPNVNYSEYKFAVKGDTIFFGLGAIKGVGQGAVESIIEARQKKDEGKFESLNDFFASVDSRALNKKVIECLIKAGAFDDFEATRSQLMASYEVFLERTDKDRKDKEIGQGSLFQLSEETTDEVEIADVPPWSKRERLQKEKEVLGFFLSDHPLDGLEKTLKRYISCEVKDLKDLEPKTKVVIGGLITSKRERMTKKATLMAFTEMEDLSGGVEVIFFPDTYADTRGHIVEDEVSLITGVLEKDGDSVKVIAEDIVSLEDKMKLTKQVFFNLTQDQVEALDDLKALLDKHPGSSKVKIRVSLDEPQQDVEFSVDDPEGIDPSRELLESLQSRFGNTDFVELA